MSNGPYAGLRMAARAGKPDPESNTEDMPEDDEDCSESKDKKKESDMTDTNINDQAAALAKASADATAAANARFGAVLASEHYAGREDLAKTLLGTDLSADDIVTALAAAPVSVQAEATDEGAQMLAQMRQNANVDLGQGEDSGPESEAADNYGWGAIHEEIRAERAGQ